MLRVASCLEPWLSRLRLAEPAEATALGFARFTVIPTVQHRVQQHRDTSFLGYELVVSARRDGRDFGSTQLRLRPNTVPNLQLRATPVLAETKQQIEIEAIRGPKFLGDLPEKLSLQGEQGEPIEAKVDAKTHKTHFALPTTASN